MKVKQPEASGQKVPWDRVAREAFQIGMMKYVFAAQSVSGKVVLDTACGVGHGSYYLVGHGAKKLVGGDLAGC